MLHVHPIFDTHEFLYSASMEVSYPSLLAAMDNLWFHQIILSSEPISAIYSKSGIQSYLAEVSNHLEDDGVSTDSITSSTTSQEDHRNELQRIEIQLRTIPSSMNNKSQSKTSFPRIQRPRKSLSYHNDRGQQLQTFLNCKILRDLEQVEVKGFLDLGFEFEKDQLSPRTMNIIPGLLSLEEKETINVNKSEDKVEKEKLMLATPYLSDAWLVKKPDSPLLRLRMARVSTAQDMKDCLKLWARIVASSIQSIKEL